MPKICIELMYIPKRVKLLVGLQDFHDYSKLTVFIGQVSWGTLQFDIYIVSSSLGAVPITSLLA
jgi:hypothetical protein